MLGISSSFKKPRKHLVVAVANRSPTVRDLLECVGRSVAPYGAIVLTAACEGRVGCYSFPYSASAYISAFPGGMWPGPVVCMQVPVRLET